MELFSIIVHDFILHGRQDSEYASAAVIYTSKTLLNAKLNKKYFLVKISQSCISARSCKYFRGVFRSLPNIYDEAFCENSCQVLTANYFAKKAPS